MTRFVAQRLLQFLRRNPAINRIVKSFSSLRSDRPSRVLTGYGSPSSFILTIVGSLALLVLIANTSLQRDLAEVLARSIEFKIREFLGKAPHISPKLKILIVNVPSSMRDEPGSSPLGIISRVALKASKFKPKMILIADDLLTYAGSPREIARLREAAGRHQPIYSALSLMPYSVLEAESTHLRRSEFLKASYAPEQADWSWLTLQASTLNGPDPRLASLFTGLGHSKIYSDFATPLFIRVSSDHIVPHLAAFVAESIEVGPNNFRIDEHGVPTDSSGIIYINHPSPNSTLQNLRLINSVRSLSSAQLGYITPNDLVLIVPKQAPLPPSVSHVRDLLTNEQLGLIGLVNTITTRHWLIPHKLPPAYSLTAVIIGALLGLYSPFFVLLSLMLSLMFLIVFVSTLVFLNGGIVVNWAVVALALALSAGVAFVIRAVHLEGKLSRLQRAMQKVLAGRKGDWTAVDQRNTAETREQIVTIMFIDIAGFSVLTEQHHPELIFHQLKSHFDYMSRIVQKYGGIIDKSLGDGLLCIFGYGSERWASATNHANNAIVCAVEIQQVNMQRNLANARYRRPVMPLRIGINTASVFLGDLGDEQRFDLAVIGNGVNFAQRLESACEIQSILVSQATHNFATNFNTNAETYRKLIKVKHHEDVNEAIELDPFVDQPKKRLAILTALRKQMNLSRKEQRYLVASAESQELSSNFGVASLLDFSQSGISVKLANYLAKGLNIEFPLADKSSPLFASLKAGGIDCLMGEVRWAKVSPVGFIHGIKITNLSQNQLKYLYGLLRDHLGDQVVQPIELGA